jgi:RNA polymerase sigma-70 factor (ECF subfamily)
MDEGQRMRTEEEARLFEDMMTCREAVFRICLGFTRNPSDAEDLSQDVFLKACDHLEKLRRASSVREWLFRIARNTCLDHAKKQRSHRLLEAEARPADVPGPSAQERSTLTKERLALLKAAVSRLPKKQREVFVLREYGRLSYEELGRVVGAKAGTVMSRLNRARAAVARCVREAGHE